MPIVRVPSRTEALESKAVLNFGNAHYISLGQYVWGCLEAPRSCSDVMHRYQWYELC